MKRDKQFVITLEEDIHARGAMSKLISDINQYEVSNHANIILQALFIDDCNIEPHYQHHNLAEHQYQ